MRITTRGAQPHPDVDINGATVTIAGQAVNCDTRQDDSRVIIDVRRDNSGHVQLGGSGYQLASVAIPPRNYTAVDTGNVDDEGKPIYEQQPVPLNPNTVHVTLWTQ